MLGGTSLSIQATLALVVGLVVGLTGAGTVSASTVDYQLTNGPGLDTLVTPLSNGETIVDLYDLVAPGIAQTGYETPDVSYVFLWEDPDGTLALVFLHDAPDTSGGSAAWTISGIDPLSGSWVVMDDAPGGTPTTDDFEDAQDLSPTWAWADCCTDGGAWQGGLDTDFSVVLTPDGWEGLTDWVFLTGDARDPTEVPLTVQFPATITRTAAQPVPELPTGLLTGLALGTMALLAVGWRGVLRKG